jgi:hypothetical protein
MRNIIGHVWFGALILVSAAILSTTERASAATCVSFGAFPASNSSVVLAKLSFVGVQERPVRSVGFAVNSSSFNINLFTPCKSHTLGYSGDPTLTVDGLTSEDMANFISAASSVNAVKTGGVASQPYLSFSLYNTTSNTGFEVILDQADASSLLQAIRTALDANASALQSVNALGCFSDLKEPGTPNDVSSSVRVAISGLRLNRTTGRFVGTVTVTNTSNSSIQGPISVVFTFGGQVQLNNPTGLTCGTNPVGLGYLNMPLTGNSLNAAASTSAALDLDNPNLEPVTATTKVLAGSGAR